MKYNIETDTSQLKPSRFPKPAPRSLPHATSSSRIPTPSSLAVPESASTFTSSSDTESTAEKRTGLTRAKQRIKSRRAATNVDLSSWASSDFEQQGFSSPSHSDVRSKQEEYRNLRRTASKGLPAFAVSVPFCLLVIYS